MQNNLKYGIIGIFLHFLGLTLHLMSVTRQQYVFQFIFEPTRQNKRLINDRKKD